ncbi:MAG: glycosyltransferase family 1 protein [Bacteroidales bacterium]
MRIGIEAQRIFREKKHGMDMVVLELIKNLKLIYNQNEYYIFVNPDQDRCITTQNNFTVVEVNGGPYPTWEQVALPIAAKKHKCDILHCTSNTAPLFGKTHLIITLHDIIYLESLNLFGGSATAYQKFGNLYRRLVVPKAVKKSLKVVTVSEFEKKRISDFMGLKDNLVSIYNGVGEHFKVISDKEALELCKKKYNLPDKFFFFLGNTDPKKNTPNLLKAFAHFIKNSQEEYKLVMLDFPEEALQQILNNIECSNIRDKIVLLGYVSNIELPQIINLSSLFLYPSLRESFGIPILEGMACGVPVITSNSSSMPEVAGDAALLIDPNNYLTIADAINKIVENPTLRESLVNKGLTRAAQFSWLKMAEKYLTLYNQVYKLIK